MAFAKLLKTSFKIICIAICITLLVWHIISYIYSDDDLIQLEFTRFHSSENRVYPSLTICFNVTTPKQHFFGMSHASSEARFPAKRPNCSRVELEDYIKTIVIKDFENNIVRYTTQNHGSKREKNLSTHFYLRRYKAVNCIAIGIPFMMNQEIKSMHVRLRKDVFSDERTAIKQCMSINKWSRMSFGLSYLHQFFPLMEGKEKQFGLKELNQLPGFAFHVGGMEIINRRNKQNDPCNSFVNEKSIEKLEDITNELGCKPENWDTPSPLPDCSKKEIIKYKKILVRGLQDSFSTVLLEKPCRYIQSILHHWELDEMPERYDSQAYNFSNSTQLHNIISNDTFPVTVVYKNLPFQEITFVPAKSLSNLAAGLMAIIGFMLGFSLYHVPNQVSSGFLQWMFRFSRSHRTDVDITNRRVLILEDPFVFEQQEAENYPVDNLEMVQNQINDRETNV